MTDPARKAAERICGGIVAATPDRVAAIVRTAYEPLLQQVEEALDGLIAHLETADGQRTYGDIGISELALDHDRASVALAALREALGERNEP